jgi:hypothetical protein
MLPIFFSAAGEEEEGGGGGIEVFEKKKLKERGVGL